MAIARPSLQGAIDRRRQTPPGMAGAQKPGGNYVLPGVTSDQAQQGQMNTIPTSFYQGVKNPPVAPTAGGGAGAAPTPAPPAQPTPIRLPPGVGSDPQQGLAFSPQYAELYRNLDSQGVSAQSAMERMLQMLQQDTEQGTRQLGEAQTDAQRLLRDRMASQGILRSGITQQESGRVGNEYLNRISGVQQGAARQEEDIRRSLAERMQALLGERTSLQMQQARDQATAQQEADRQAAAAAAAQQQLQQQQPQPSPTGQYQQPSGRAPWLDSKLAPPPVPHPVGGYTAPGLAPKSGMKPSAQDPEALARMAALLKGGR